MNIKTMSSGELMELLEKREERIGKDQEVVNSIEGELLRRRLDSLKKVDVHVVGDLLANGYSDLSGDAGKSQSEWFRCLSKTVGPTCRFVIQCPQFLRGPLRLYVNLSGDEARMSNSY